MDNISAMKQYLVLDFGNTSLKWAILEDDHLLRSKFGIDNRLIGKFIKTLSAPEFSNVCSILITSVINPLHLEEHLFKIRKIKPLPVFIAESLPSLLGLHNGYEISNRLGVDRWLGMLGAWVGRAHFGAVMAIDIGTALTIDVINEQGQHLGGFIQPGMRLMRESLFQNTAAVMVDDIILTDELGRTTKECVGGGLYHAIIGACVNAILDASTQFNPLTIYVSGGNGLWLKNELSRRLPLQSQIIYLQNMVFTGLIAQAKALKFL